MSTYREPDTTLERELKERLRIQREADKAYTATLRRFQRAASRREWLADAGPVAFYVLVAIVLVGVVALMTMSTDERRKACEEHGGTYFTREDVCMKGEIKLP